MPRAKQVSSHVPKGLFIILSAIVLSMFWAVSILIPSKKPDAPIVAATIYPLYDITKQIAGEEVDVILALDTNEVGLIRDVSNAHILFSIGHGFDDWSWELTENTNVSIETVDSTIEIIDDNPYYWLSPANAMLIAEEITQSLISIKPESEDIFLENLSRFNVEARLLHQDIAQLPKGNNLKTPTEWEYFERDYDLNLDFSGLEPEGNQYEYQGYIDLMRQNFKLDDYSR